MEPLCSGEPGPAVTSEVLTVSEITGVIRRILDDPRLQDIWVQGEITGFKCHHSGHCYFSLTEKKGGKSFSLDCVMWRTDAGALPFSPASGMDVLAFGYVDHYPAQGRIQFYVQDIRRAGEGEKHLLVERWRRELREEGHFAPERKRPLPGFPRRIGVVTSPTGAVIEDIKTVVQRRFPVEILLSPAPVQGDGAHLAIASALRRIDGKVDVIIIARGGGSFDDLFPFNHPEVVRAVGSCRCPVVSAIGHEVDVTLCDLAADVRAPTPSAAAELVVRDRANLRSELNTIGRDMEARIGERLERARQGIEDLRLHLHPRRLRRRVVDRRQELVDLQERCVHAVRGRMEKERLTLAGFSARLAGRDPSAPLQRGYCIATKQGRSIRSVRELTPGDRVRLRWRDGEAESRVEEVIHGQDLRTDDR